MWFHRRNIYGICLVFCLIVSAVCFDGFKTGGFAYPYSETAPETPVITAGSSISSEDACTIEMLGHVHTVFQARHFSLKNCERQRKSETISVMSRCAISLSAFSRYVLTASYDGVTDDTDSAEILQFIHNKDGKKKF